MLLIYRRVKIFSLALTQFFDFACSGMQTDILSELLCNYLVIDCNKFRSVASEWRVKPNWKGWEEILVKLIVEE